MRGRNLQVGDEAMTDYNGNGFTQVTITARVDAHGRGFSQSGILFQVSPLLRNGDSRTWYDADWFEPVPKPVSVEFPEKSK